ncbi:MAG TPA: hypothetical protein VN668_17675 [Stellaceae bacterium]|nr:hypothetical protein [Stellaceae bacterium]
MPSWREVSHGMYGAWRLACLDSAAMAWFARGIGGVWRSFWAAAITYPGFILIISLLVTDQQWVSAGGFRILLVESIGYVVSWTVFPLVILPICHWLERDEQSLEFITAYNWSQVLQTVLALIGLIAFRFLPAGGSAIYLALLAARLGYEWFIARTALEAGGVAATTVVLIDLVLSEAVAQVTQSLY